MAALPRRVTAELRTGRDRAAPDPRRQAGRRERAHAAAAVVLTVTPFSGVYRAQDVAAVTAAPVDVLVVGMGATGAGVALDAASRGLTVAVLDRGDLASGTSSKSSKLIHGGLRYLEHYEFSLVHEGVTERQMLLRLAPHLVTPMDFLLPVWPDTARRRLLGVGLTAYDVFAGLRNVRRHERLSAAEAIERAPALASSGLYYAYVYGDSGTDDVRLVLAVIRAARRFGATALPYSEVTGLLHADDGRVCGATVHDLIDGSSYEIQARHVVNATGVWVDALMGMAEPGRAPAVQPSKGVHLVVPRAALPLDGTSVLMPSKQGDGRSMFAIPWGRQVILGTTDTAYTGPLDSLAVTTDDVEYVLAAVNAVFGTSLSESDVVGAWAGVRPLMRDEPADDDPGAEQRMSDVSRRHLLIESPDGLLTITGGKLTTFRRMAEDVVDRIVDQDGHKARCRTDQIPLGCARPLDDVIAETIEAASALRVTEEQARSLVRQHGETAADVLSLVAADPSLADLISPDTPHLFAEVVYAVRREGALTLDDVFTRRMRLSLRTRDAALFSAERAALLMSAELGRDDAWAHGQVSAYADAVRRERGPIGLAVQASLS